MSDICTTNSNANDASRHGCVLSIGNFDGVHLGHQLIVQTARAVAQEKGAKTIVATFDPPPEMILRPDNVAKRLTSLDEKKQLLLDAGADEVVTLHADANLLAMSPQNFIDEIIVEKFKPVCMVEGPNFFFGRRREGNVECLAEAGKRANFDVQVIDPLLLELDGQKTHISSTLIRSLIGEGKIDQANRCLAREFTITGNVVGGYRRGRLLDYPTVNIEPGLRMTPADGIYAGRATVQGAKHPAAISIGDNPTFGPAERTIEAFLLNVEADFYDESITLHFIRHLRSQERFDDTEALKAQIARDVQQVREICR